MAFADAVAGLDALVNSELGESITYTPAASGTPAVISAVEVFETERDALTNALANVVDHRRRWSFLKTDVAQPVIGDSLTVGADTFKVDDIDEVGTDRYRWVVVVV